VNQSIQEIGPYTVEAEIGRGERTSDSHRFSAFSQEIDACSFNHGIRLALARVDINLR
jgi:hypothetical protein